MSQAEALLNSLSADQVSTSTYTSYSVNYVSDHFVIGEDRFIVVPANQKKLGVQTDDNVKTVTFDCLRYWDGRDISKMKIYINYELPNGESSGDIAENVMVDTSNTNIIHFDWTITANVTPAKGNISFLVCARRTDENGIQINHWNSELCTECYISEGLEVTGVTTKQYNDITTRLLTLLTDIEGSVSDITQTQIAAIQSEAETQKAAVEAIGAAAKASIPADYTALSELVDSTERSKADAIVVEASGSNFAVTDASNDYLRGLRIYGKSEQIVTTGVQLVDFSAGSTATGVTATFNNNVLTVKGDGALQYQSWSKDITALITEHPGEILYFTYEKLTTNAAHDGTIVQLNINHSDNSKTYVQLVSVSGAKKYYTIPSDTSNIATVHMGVYTTNAASAKSNTVTIVKPMLQYGLDVLDYESYSNRIATPCPDYPQDIKTFDNGRFSIFGKNLLNNVAVTGTSNGITFTINDDKSVTVNGTSTDNGLLNMLTTYTLPKQFVPGVKYLVSGATSDVTIQVYEHNATSNGWVYRGSGKTDFEVTFSDEAAGVLIRLAVNPSVTINNVTVYPMIRLASIEDSTYEPFVEEQSIIFDAILHDGDYVDFELGKLVKHNKTITLNGTENWAYYSSADGVNQFYAIFNDCLVNNNTVNVVADKLRGISLSQRSYNYNSIYTAVQSGNNYLCINMKGYTTAADFKAFLADNPINVTYKLKEPIVTDLTTELTTFKALHTNKSVTTFVNDSGVRTVIKYNADTGTYLIQNETRTDQEANNRFSNAIQESLTGEVVRADDVSSVEHELEVKVSSRNLARFDNKHRKETSAGITFIYQDDGTVVANGTATSTAYYLLQIGTGYTSQIPIEKGTYTIGLAPGAGCRIVAGVRETEADDRTLYSANDTSTSTFEVTSDTARYDIILCVDSGATVTNAVFRPMLVRGTTVGEFTPYVNSDTVTVSRYSKNLLDYTLIPTSLSNGGVTATRTGDVITLNGTTTEAVVLLNTAFCFAAGLGKDYTLSIIPISGTGDCACCIGDAASPNAARNSWLNVRNATSAKTITYKATKPYVKDFWLYIASGITFNNFKFRVQLELGTAATDYESSKRETYEAVDGVAKIPSISPSISLVSDTAGIVLDTVYNVDTKTYIKNLILEELAKIQNGNGVT